MICANAQENIHYQWMDFYGKNLGTDRKAFNPRKIDLPSVDGFNAYTADLHMHTIYSDAQVTPEMRVYEAYLEGLDILAITDHHSHPRVYRGSDDMNVAVDCAVEAAKDFDLKIVRGFEITGSEPVGHINVLFTGDLNKYRLSQGFDTKECDKVLEIARGEDAFITTNHPGWPDQNSDLSDYIAGHIKDGTIQGIEVFNHKEFYPLAIDHALNYNLAMLGCTDSHYPTYMLYDQKDNHRDLTIIFAKDKSDEAIKEALRARRTIAWANNMLCGEESLLLSFIKAAVKVERFRTLESGEVLFRLYNSCSVPFYLSAENSNENIYLPAGGYAELKRRKEDLKHIFKVDNVYCGSTSHPSFPLSFLLEAGKIAAPYLKEESLAIDDDGISFRFAPSMGTIYYTLDGSEPTEQSTCYDGNPVVLAGGARVKAICKRGGSVSGVYERNIPYAAAVKAKARRQGVNFKYFEGADMSSTEEIDKLEKVTFSGQKRGLNISEGEGKDYFGYVFEGVMKIEQSGLYTFTLLTNDGSDLYIDGVLACDNNVRTGYTVASGSIFLQKGFHKYRIRYFEGYGGESFALKWQAPGDLNAKDFPAALLFVE